MTDKGSHNDSGDVAASPRKIQGLGLHQLDSAVFHDSGKHGIDRHRVQLRVVDVTGVAPLTGLWCQ